jgi:hypothetical protein
MRIAAILVLVLLMLVGLIKELLWKRRVIARREFCIQFSDRLGDYVASRGSDVEAYGWLTHRASRMQREMGSAGIVHTFRPPFANFAYQNYPIVLNMLPELRRWATDSPRPLDQFREYAAALHEALIRYDGQLVDALEHSQKQLWNPFVHLREGVQFVLLLPFRILGWLGFGGETLQSRLAGMMLVRVLSALVALATLIASLVTVISGGEQAVSIVRRLLG